MKAVLNAAGIGAIVMLMSIFCILFGIRTKVMLIIGVVLFLVGVIPVVYCMLRLWKVHKKTKLGTVKEVALHVIKINAPYYSEDLIVLIPPELLKVGLTNETLHEIGVKIDEIRFQKEREFALMAGFISYGEGDKEQLDRLAEMINSDIGSLSEEQEAKKREIKFLSNLAQTIIHQ